MSWKIAVFLIAILLLGSGVVLGQYHYIEKDWVEGYWASEVGLYGFYYGSEEIFSIDFTTLKVGETQLTFFLRIKNNLQETCYMSWTTHGLPQDVTIKMYWNDFREPWPEDFKRMWNTWDVVSIIFQIRINSNALEGTVNFNEYFQLYNTNKEEIKNLAGERYWVEGFWVHGPSIGPYFEWGVAFCLSGGILIFIIAWTFLPSCEETEEERTNRIDKENKEKRKWKIEVEKRLRFQRNMATLRETDLMIPTWKCKYCRMDNDESDKLCVVCGSPRRR